MGLENSTFSTHQPGMIPSGIEGLDKYLDGGITEGTTVLLMAEPGAGSSLFIQQFAYGGIENNEYVLFFDSEQRPEMINSNMARFGMNIYSHIGKNINIIDVHKYHEQGRDDEFYNKYMKDTDINTILEQMLSEITENESDKKCRTIVYSLSYFIRLVGLDPVVEAIESLSKRGDIHKSVNFLHITKGMHGTTVENTLKQVCDTVIELQVEERSFNVQRTIFIRKLYGSIAPDNFLPYYIGKEGIKLDTTKRIL
mgnify:CR=1 FL=1